MKTLKKPIAALVLFASGAPAFAGEPCDERALNALRPLMKVDRPAAGVRMLASACKVLPNDPHRTAAAIVFRGEPSNVEDVDEKLLVSLIDNRSFQVIAAHDQPSANGIMYQDDPEYALGIDTARYNVSEEVFVFGIDFFDNYSERRACDWDGGPGPTLTLFAYDKEKSIRPILSMDRSAWIYRECRFVSEPQSIVVEESRTILAVGKTKTHGYADLLVHVSSSLSVDRDLFKSNPKRKPLRTVIRYDGRQYDIKPYELARDKWFNR